MYPRPATGFFFLCDGISQPISRLAREICTTKYQSIFRRTTLGMHTARCLLRGAVGATLVPNQVNHCTRKCVTSNLTS